jgi:hypothetical protein
MFFNNRIKLTIVTFQEMESFFLARHIRLCNQINCQSDKQDTTAIWSHQGAILLYKPEEITRVCRSY